MQPVSHREEVPRWDTWCATAVAYRRRGYPTDNELGGWSTAALAVTQSGTGFLPGQAYLLYTVHESQQEIDLRRQLTGDERGLSRDLLQFRVYCTMAELIQSPDRAFWSMVSSQFCVVTKLALCIKIIAWQSSYNFVMAILIKFSIIQAWIHA
jgi:hypothetical protein